MIDLRNSVFQKTNNIELDIMETDKGFNMQRHHYHETFEVYLMLEGKRNLFLHENHYLMKKGDILIVKPYSLHATNSANPSYFKRFLLNFSPSELSALSEIYDTKKLTDNLFSCLISLNHEQFDMVYNSLKFLDRLTNKYRKNKTHSNNMLVKMSLVQLIEYLSDLSKGPSVTKFEEDLNSISSPVTSALSYINSHFGENISLDFISDYVHMSKSNFCLVFKKAVGDTFTNYLNSLRISQVHRLILSTDLSLSDIAEQTGFASVDYMTRTFKKLNGIYPSTMRKVNKQKNTIL